MAIALHHSKSRGTTKVVLLGIANHHGDGGAWPSLETLAVYANVTPDNVRKAVQDLERMAEVQRDVQQGGLAITPDYGRPNLYQFLLKCPPNCDGSTNHRVLCVACGKPVAGQTRRRRELYHPKCTPVSNPVDNTPHQNGGGGGIDAQTILPPNPLDISARLSDRVRASTCPVRRPKPHYSTNGRYCDSCGKDLTNEPSDLE